MPTWYDYESECDRIDEDHEKMENENKFSELRADLRRESSEQHKILQDFGL